VGDFFQECLRMIGELHEVDLQDTERLKASGATLVVETLEQLETALLRRPRELNG
jgi:hypothetical protein